MNDSTLVASIEQILLQPLRNLGASVIVALPNVLQALLAILIGYVAASILRRFTKHILRAIGIDVIYRRLTQKEHLTTEGLVGGPSDLGALAVYWSVMLSAALYALQILGLSEAAILLYRLVSYLPMVFISIAIVTIGLYAADLFNRVVTAAADSAKLPMPRLWGLGVQHATIGFTALAVLDYLQIATTSVLLVVAVAVSVVPVAAIIAFGWGGRRQAEELVTGRAYRAYLEPGDTITFHFGGELIEGAIEELGPTIARIRTSEGECLVPYTALLTAKTLVRKSTK